MRHINKILRIFIWFIIDISIVLIVALGILVIHLENELPDVSVLKDVKMQVPLRIYTADGKLIAEYGEKRRIPVPYEEIPPQLVNAVLATEDQRFFQHPGVDFYGLLRAAVQVVATGTKSQGGSTITMQVARNFFLSPKKTYTRKLKEILLAMKIEQALSKQKILDLYLNKIYFGSRAYGVAAAAQAYFGKTLDQLTLSEMAMIAGLPKAPSGLNPITNPKAALERRNHVLARMLEHGYINQQTYNEAVKEPLNAGNHDVRIDYYAPYMAEMVRNAMVSQFGEDDAYTQGYNVYTTINSNLQSMANQALTNALLDYDQRHGYRGPVKNLGLATEENIATWPNLLKKIPAPSVLIPAVVTKVNENSIDVLLANNTSLTIDWDGLKWARRRNATGYIMGTPTRANQIAEVGDVIYVRELPNKAWQLAQIPRAQAALVALNPQDGAIKALTGGFDYNLSKFNRITQALRQPGSSFKPFIYAAALAKGFTLASVINDAPIVVNSPDGTLWRPQNSNKKFYGPTRLRVALMKSRNLVSIRLLQMVGIRYTIHYLDKFGFSSDQLPHSLSLALGTASLTPLELATGYMVFANGGYQVKPYFIDHILNSQGEPIYQAQPAMACEKCVINGGSTPWLNPDEPPPVVDDSSPQNIAPLVITPQIAYLMTSAMKDVIQGGTASQARSLGRYDLAGKTGTTNDKKDAWFAGYNSDLVTVTWIGFDQPQSLHEYGARAALPMWMEFMANALAGQPEHSIPQPPGLITMRIDASTGNAAAANDKNSLFETFTTEATPITKHNSSNWSNPDEAAATENTMTQTVAAENTAPNAVPLTNDPVPITLGSANNDNEDTVAEERAEEREESGY